MQKRIGVISDTHGLLREEVKTVLKSCQVILHGGDFHTPQVYEELSSIARLYAVRGNGDGNWAKGLPETQKFQLYGLRFFMIHDRKQIREDLSDRDIVIFGHSHQYREQKEGGQLWLNPGSCGPRRFSLPVTMAVLTASDGAYQLEKITFAEEEKKAAERLDKLPAGKEKIVIRAMMKEQEKGKTIAWMAQKHGISEELVRQICRIIVTHPGVDADGIFDRVQMMQSRRY